MPAISTQNSQNNIFNLTVQWPKHHFWNATFDISNYWRQNKYHFWNPETKLDKKCMLLTEDFEFRNLDLFYLTFNFPRVKYKNECHHNILRPRWPLKYVSHNTYTFSFGHLIWPSLGLRQIQGLYLYGVLFIPWVAFWHTLAAIFSPASTGGKAKSDYFEPWPGLWFSLKKIFKLSWKVLVEGFPLLPARLYSNWFTSQEGGGRICPPPPPQESAFGVIPQRGAE